MAQRIPAHNGVAVLREDNGRGEQVREYLRLVMEVAAVCGVNARQDIERQCGNNR